MKKDVFRFGYSLMITGALLVVVDVVIGFAADTLAWNMPNFSGQIAKDNYRLHRAEQDILIIGSSRGAHHYVTSQLRDSISNYIGRPISVYNAAIQGKFANSNCCAAEVILSRYHPKLVIFDMPERQLLSNDVLSDIEFASPYYWRDEPVRNYLDNISTKERVLMKSSLYRYNGKVARIIFSYFQKVPEDDGYVPLSGSLVDPSYVQVYNNGSKLPNEYTVNNLKNVFSQYRIADVPLIMACSPEFRPGDNNHQLSDLCKNSDVVFIDLYDTDYFNSKPELFRDYTHLNDEGAHEYTRVFFEKLKPYLKTALE